METLEWEEKGRGKGEEAGKVRELVSGKLAPCSIVQVQGECRDEQGMDKSKRERERRSRGRELTSSPKGHHMVLHQSNYFFQWLHTHSAIPSGSQAMTYSSTTQSVISLVLCSSASSHHQQTACVEMLTRLFQHVVDLLQDSPFDVWVLQQVGNAELLGCELGFILQKWQEVDQQLLG